MTAYDVSTLTFQVSGSCAQDISPRGMAFNNDGTKVYMVGSNTRRFYQYSCGTAAGGSLGKININGTWKSSSAAYVNINNVWKTVSSAKINQNGTWKTIF
jgi:hypothetical protein